MTRLFTVCAVVGGLLASPAQAQQTARKTPTASEVKKAVEHLASLPHGEGDNGEAVGYVARKVVAYLKAHRLDDDQANELGLTIWAASDDQAQLCVYYFSHDSGGTRGTVDNVVLQWQNAAGKLFAYHLPVECAFTELHPLKTSGRRMYLLLGREKANTFCLAFTAYVLELKGDYLILDNQVFSVNGYSNKNELSACNVEMTFDPVQQLLSVDIDDGIPEREEGDGYSTEPFKPFKLLFQHGRFVPLR
ncbi:hypothetical protein K3G63_05450 [Hymenobacter sp. HSC-4F20]|uniref:hypothetical protein n=1 Tax=Hymenobacter sp. HSC-4F20 TaxID=2864135 RepID=UPI001C73208A|nr:hypothetical protein [Hymenobacter sp. HSC-4F20]MBX0289873.1 hypothetical protein [Hymenobacter sp. HSC-4F20]